MKAASALAAVLAGSILFSLGCQSMSEADIASRLRTLKSLDEQGLITPAEYERTKQRLLDRLVEGPAIRPSKPAPALKVTFTPNERIVFQGKFDGEAIVRIYSVKPNGTGLANLTADLDWDAVEPAISPDGKHIAFRRASGADNEVWVMASDGSDKRKVHTTDPNFCATGVSWKGNQTIVYAEGTAGHTFRPQVRCVDLDGKNVKTLVASPFMGQGSGYFVKCSPGGDRIACIWQQENWSPTEDLYVTDGDGGNSRVLYRDPGDDHLDRTPVWSRDGKTVYWGHRMSAGYDETAENSAAIVCKSVASSRPETAWDSIVVPNNGRGKWLMSVSPDGSRLAFTDSSYHLYVHDIKTSRSACVLSGDLIGPGEWGTLDKPR